MYCWSLVVVVRVLMCMRDTTAVLQSSFCCQVTCGRMRVEMWRIHVPFLMMMAARIVVWIIKTFLGLIMGCCVQQLSVPLQYSILFLPVKDVL